MVNEEGLAAINTIYRAQVKMLFLPALLYCKYFERIKMAFSLACFHVSFVNVLVQ